MDVEHLLELVVTHLLNHAVERVAGVRDDDVETVEGLDRGVDEAVAEIGVGDVDDAGDGIDAERLDSGYQLGRRRLVETGGASVGDGAGRSGWCLAATVA